jgi:hypothetical protein
LGKLRLSFDGKFVGRKGGMEKIAEIDGPGVARCRRTLSLFSTYVELANSL